MSERGTSKPFELKPEPEPTGLTPPNGQHTEIQVGQDRRLFRIVRTQIPNEVGPAPCCATSALNQADKTHTPASPCLPAMPLPLSHSCLEAASACYPPLELGVLTRSEQGWSDWAG